VTSRAATTGSTSSRTEPSATPSAMTRCQRAKISALVETKVASSSLVRICGQL
jgi:hypothetical protein